MAISVLGIIGYHVQGFIQYLSVGVGKMMHVEPRPLGGVGGMLRIFFSKFTFSEVASGAPKGWKLATK